jgi:predicted anti-sigma-YlaC factor YlaD
MDELLASREQMNRASTEFLRLDLETALTFVKIARQTHDHLQKKRNCRAARRAYETVAKLAKKADFNTENGRAMRLGLAQLRAELEELGETF